MQSIITECMVCGTNNRITERLNNGVYRCGRCSGIIPNPVLYIIVDCETTGLPTEKSDPFLVQLAWSIHDCRGMAIEEHCFIIRPGGYEIPKSAENIHGISHDFASQWGAEIKDVLLSLSRALKRANTRLIGHNLEFDIRVLRAECNRVRISPSIFKLPTFCTMLGSVQLCKLPKRGIGYKWPSLQELHSFLFGKCFPDGHSALNDVRVTAKCFFELCRRGLVNRI